MNRPIAIHHEAVTEKAFPNTNLMQEDLVFSLLQKD
jgi:hypothetical protein